MPLAVAAQSIIINALYGKKEDTKGQTGFVRIAPVCFIINNQKKYLFAGLLVWWKVDHDYEVGTKKSM